jgi:hypothetical protein
MRKLMPLLMVLAIATAAGCGGGGDAADSALDNALGYLPAEAPFAAALDTEVDGDQYDAARDVLERFGVRDQVDELLGVVVQDRAGELESVERALGNEFVVGSPSTAHFTGAEEAPEGEDAPVVGAIQATDEGALDDLVQREGVEEDGEANGAQLYKDDSGDSFAVEGDTLIVAGSKPQLEQALETRDGDERLTEDDFETATEGLPEDALLRIYLDVGAIVRASDDSADALKVKWVDAVRTGGLSLAFSDGEVAIDINVNTDSEDLTEDDLPIAAGAQAPEVLDRPGEIAISLRDPAQIVEFAQRAARTADPDGFGVFAAGRAQIERRLDIDIEQDLLGQLEDDLQISIHPDGDFGARAGLENPERFERTLGELGEVLPGVLEGVADKQAELTEPGRGEDFYELATDDGESVVFGVVEGAFVLGGDASIAEQLANAETRGVDGAEGSVVLNGDAEQLIGRLLDEVGSDDLGGFPRPDRDALRPFDELIGSLEASTERLSASFRLTLDGRRGGDANE